MPERRGRFIYINNFSGGLADSDILGVKGSFAEGVGLNIHSKPGILTPNQALAKSSGSTVTDLPQFGFYGTDGGTYWFGDSGKIYRRTSGGTWSNVYTDGGGAILGAIEFNGYFYWATATSLHEMIITGNWTTDVDSVATWPKSLTTATWHPMAIQGLYLLIGNATRIATVDSTQVFTANGTSAVTLNAIPPGQQISSIVDFGIDVIVGTKTTSGDNNALCLRWDTVSPNYTQSIPVQESIIANFIKYENRLFAQCGQSGNLYFYDGSTLQKFKRIIGDYDNKTMTCLPGSVTNFRGLPMFGVSNSSSNPCNQGVYSLGRYDKNYPMALNLEYVVSGQATGHVTNVTVGALVAFGNTLMVAWKDTTSGTVYGVDAIDWTAKYASAYYKTTAITGERVVNKVWKNFVLAYTSLPASTALTFSYYPNYGSQTSLTIATQSKSTNTYYAQGNIEAGVMQFRVDFTTSSNSAPSMEALYADWIEDHF